MARQKCSGFECNKRWILTSAVCLIFGFGCGEPNNEGTEKGTGSEADSSTETDTGDAGDMQSEMDSDTGSEEGDTETKVVISDLLPLDDCNDGDARNAFGGFWATFDDQKDEGTSTVVPAPNPDRDSFAMTEGGVDDGYAVHITGETGGVLGWDYVGIITTLGEHCDCPDPEPTSVDLTQYDGLRFMAKGSVAGGNLLVRIPHSKDGEEDNCSADMPDTLTEWADPEVSIVRSLGEDWTEILVDFRQFAQPSWAPTLVDFKTVLEHAKRIQWIYQTKTPGTLDLWIDDVGFYKADRSGEYPKQVLSKEATGFELWDNPDDDGSLKMSIVDAAGEDFDKAVSVEVVKPPTMRYDGQIINTTTGAVTAGDVLQTEFYARCDKPLDALEQSAECLAEMYFEKNADPYTPSATYMVRVGPEWTRFAVPFVAAETHAAGEAQLTFRLGYTAETFQVGGVSLVDYGNTKTLDELERTALTYEGREADAAWRTEAAARIETLRKGDIAVTVKDADGNPVPDAEVHALMTAHQFHFGTAFNDEGMRYGYSDEDKAAYEAAMGELFNTAVTENAMHWKGLAGDWGDHFNMDMADWAVTWAEDRNFTVKGHALVWPGWGWLPNALKSDYEAALAADGEAAAATWLENEVEQHVTDLVGAMNGRVAVWDVVNEPVNNHDLMDILGNESMEKWFAAARAADPDAQLAINDFDIVTGGGIGNPHQAKYLDMVQTLADNDAALDAVGFQAHFRNNPTPPEALLSVWNDFAAAGKSLWVTEYEFASNDEQLQADYTRDLLTALFSCEAADGFVMWGFWDGARRNADKPIYNADWTLKPSGQAYIDLVTKEWWTDETGKTDDKGVFSVRGFKGRYDIEVKTGDTTTTEHFTLDGKTGELTVTLSE